MRGTTEGGGMRVAAWTRQQHGIGSGMDEAAAWTRQWHGQGCGTDKAAAWTRWRHRQDGGMDEAGNTDMGAAQMRGTTEGGGMRAAAWTR